AGRHPWPAAGCRRGAPGSSGRAVLRDGGTDAEQDRGRRRARLPVPPLRGTLRWIADAADPGRSLAVSRRAAVCGAHPAMAEDAAQEERLGRVLHPVAGRHPGLEHRTRRHRELPDPDPAPQPPGAGAASSRPLPILRPQSPADRDHCPGHAQARLLLSVPPGQPAVRARPGARRTGLRGGGQPCRSASHRPVARRSRSRRFRLRLAAGPVTRLGRRAVRDASSRAGEPAMNRSTIALAPTLLVLGLMLFGRAEAMTVIDPTNLIQNSLTAVRTLEMTHNQLRQLQNETRMLLNQARHLASLDYNVISRLSLSIARSEQLLAQAQGLAYEVTRLDREFAQLYP